MCDVALDRSGRTRPEPKIHNESATSPKIPRPFDDYPLKIKEPSTIIQALLRLELGRRGIWDGGMGGATPFLRPGHVLGLIVLLGLIICTLFVFPSAGLVMLVAFCVLIILPLKKIWRYLAGHRVLGISILLLLIAGGMYGPVSRHFIERSHTALLPDRIVSEGERSFLHGAPSQAPESALSSVSFYFTEELSWPDTKGIQYIWPMPTRAACEALLSKKSEDQMLGFPSVARCAPDKGQYDGFVRYEPNRDWYVVFQASGKVVNFVIFKLSDNMRSLGEENAFHPVWLFVKGVLTLAKKQNPPVTLTVHIISPQGEVDMDIWQLKR